MLQDIFFLHSLNIFQIIITSFISYFPLFKQPLSLTNRTRKSIATNEMNMITNKQHDKYQIIYEGLRECSCSRRKNAFIHAYRTIFMFRRLIMVIITVAFATCNSEVCSKFQVGSMFTLQILYIIYAVLLRPYEEHENNIIEIVNEFVFAFLIIICFTLPTNDEAEDSFFISYILREEIMSYTVIFSSLLVSLISTGILIGTQVLKLKR